MNDLGFHILLFLVTGFVVVLVGTAFAEPQDGPAVKSLPRRYLYFLGGCALVVAIMLIAEHTVASVS